VAETDLPDSGPCFDQTPSEHVSSVIYIFFVVFNLSQIFYSHASQYK